VVSTYFNDKQLLDDGVDFVQGCQHVRDILIRVALSILMGLHRDVLAMKQMIHA
jgi:hypothetical protein